MWSYLVFVHDLNELAREANRPIRLVTLSRGQAGSGVVAEDLPWKGTSVEDRIDKLEKDARAAKKLYENQKEDDYRREAADIYSNLRASWERGLEEIAFARVIQRHRDYVDTKNLKKAAVLNDADCDTFRAAYGKCSSIVDAHDPSSGRNAEPPSPQKIMQDIQKLKDWVASLRSRQKNIK